MKTIFSKGLIGISFSDFCDAYSNSLESGEIPDLLYRESKLIPIGKKDDEMAITSVFLSSLKYVKEFRNELFSRMGFPKNGNICCLTEVSFPLFFQDNPTMSKARFDGLILSLSSLGIIKEAMLFEMKSGNDKLDEEQMTLYLNMAKELKINYFVTVSNEFSTTDNDSPIPSIKKLAQKKKIDLFHFSWSAISTLSEKLVKIKEGGISDSDQQFLMAEVLSYFKGCGAIRTFDKMDSCWKGLMKELGSGSPVLSAEARTYVPIIVRDWIQQEKDLAIKLGGMLSDKEIIDIGCGRKGNQTMEKRLQEEEILLKEKRILQSIYRIPNAISPLIVRLDAPRKAIYLSFDVSFPEGETCKKQLAFIRADCKRAQKANSEKFTHIAKNSTLIIETKGRHDNLRFNLMDFLDPDKVQMEKGLEFKSAYILLEIDMGIDFLSPIKVIEFEEKIVSDFYEIVMQYFKKWIKPAPQIPQQTEEKAE